MSSETTSPLDVNQLPTPDRGHRYFLKASAAIVAIVTAIVTAALTVLVTDFLNQPKLSMHIVQVEQAGVDVYQFRNGALLGLEEFFTDQPEVSDLKIKVADVLRRTDVGDLARMDALRSGRTSVPIADVTKALADAEGAMPKIQEARSDLQQAKSSGSIASMRDVLDRWNADQVITVYIPETPKSEDMKAMASAVDEALKKLQDTSQENQEAIDMLKQDLAKAQDQSKQKTFVVKAFIANAGNSPAAIINAGLLKGENWNLTVTGSSDSGAASGGLGGVAIPPHQIVMLSFRTDPGQSGNSPDGQAVDIASQQFLGGGLAKCTLSIVTSSEHVLTSDPFPFGGVDRYRQHVMELLRTH
jgi:hypothetical protein